MQQTAQEIALWLTVPVPVAVAGDWMVQDDPPGLQAVQHDKVVVVHCQAQAGCEQHGLACDEAVGVAVAPLMMLESLEASDHAGDADWHEVQVLGGQDCPALSPD